MLLPKNKTAVAIALFMVLTVAASLITFLPTASAADTYYYSWVYCSVSPDVIGVNQEVLFTMWTADMPPDIGEEAAAAGERAKWENVGFYVTDPDGNTETITIAETDPVGGAWVLYTPDQIGIWTLQAWFPDTTKTEPDGDRLIYSAAESYEVTFTVQEEQIEPWPESPLTTDYWTRPINQASRAWHVLGGNWLGGDFNNYPAGATGGVTERFVWGKGPESPHILWTKPHYVGGIMDEYFGETGYQTGHYQGLDFSALIINGKMYYNYRADAHQTEGYIVVDLYTGETLRYVNDTLPSRGQIYNYDSPNQHGGYAYMWKTSGVTLPAGDITESGKQTWEMLDAYTGRSICKVANVSFGTTWFWMTFGAFGVYGKDGSLCNYNIEDLAPWGATTPDYYLTVWNVSAIVGMLGSPTGTTAWQWRPSGGAFGFGPGIKPLGYYVHDGNTAFSLNVSLAAADVDGPLNSIENQTGEIECVREGEYIIVGTQGQNNEDGVVKGKMTAFSLEVGREGTKLWTTTFTPPFASTLENLTAVGFFGQGLSMTGVYPEDGVILFHNSKTLIRYGYSLDTGELLWESEPEPMMNYYTMISNVYDGKLLTAGYGGVLLAYNMTTGEIVWNYTAKNVGFESPYGNYPINIFAICDGKIYTLTGEHSITQPMWRGPNIRCINATNGEEIFSMLGFGANGGAHLTGQYMQMADGKIVGLNYFDNQIYCIGKGPSATTVSAPELVPTVGSKVMITGTVTDQTATGRRNTNDKFDFTLKGTPAISDEDMAAWMEYMFMQQAYPADAKGVEVVLETLDPNGNFYEIGRTTSDINGNYGVMWEPPVPGEYTIFATFAGSAAYGPSYATTYMGVADAPEPTPAPTPTPAPMTDTYVLGIGAGAIIAIIAVGLILILMMRKR